MKTRPKDYNPKKPDPKGHRCINCNFYGFNRTGMVPQSYVGASTTGMWGRPCPNIRCTDGWVEIEQ